MTLKIYNSLTRTKEEFRPITAGKVKMYVCGPTVYDYIHIGNARPAIFFDVVRRYLTAIGYDVNFIVNFTDVDDKLIRRAEESGSTVAELAERYIEAFYEDTKQLGIRTASANPRVTENMEEIIAFIDGLVQKGFAYSKEGDVYFRTERFKDYGKLSHQNLDELQYGIRIEVDERKENPRDFVLWKKAKPGEIHWSSPWGEGRPGWHIECSAMAKKYLGDTIDIHGGGQDLIFPHHECETAQSEALNGKPFANYWMHNGYVNINNEKMSKSLGNGVNVNTLLKQIKPQIIRFFMLSTHYRNPANFTDDALDQAKNSLERIENCLANVNHRIQTAYEGSADPAFIATLDGIVQKFHEKMQDDFNTPDAITALFDLVTETNLYLKRDEVGREVLEHIRQIFKQLDQIMGILTEADESLLDEEIEALIVERTEARKARNWARADEIRDLLIEKGIVLEDTPQGIRWRRK